MPVNTQTAKERRVYRSDEVDNFTLAPEERLLTATLAWGRVRPDYYRDPCARAWAHLLGLEPEYLWKRAIKGTPREGEPFSPFPSCRRV